jgi:hypothetical protein
MSETHSGGCLCGGVQYVVTGPLRDVVNCHCGQCRRTHGHFAGYTEAPLSDFKLNRSDTLKWYQSSPQARRGFCSVCGASLFWAAEGEDHVAIAAGTLDEPTGLRTVALSMSPTQATTTRSRTISRRILERSPLSSRA